MYVPGCDEHYLVHIMRKHPDFIPDLAFVALDAEKIIGGIMYTKSAITDASGRRMDTVTFGPVCVLPEYQKKGAGSALISHTKEVALEMGFKAIIIHGHPKNYCRHGFKSAKDYSISDAEGKFPFSMLVFELEKDAVPEGRWQYIESDVYHIDETEAARFDEEFPAREKKYEYTQEEFSIASRAYLE